MKEFAVYTVARLGLFAVSYALIVGIYLVFAGGPIPLFWPFLLAVVVSAVASAFLLRSLRDRFALVVQERAQRATQKVEEMRAKEDEPER